VSHHSFIRVSHHSFIRVSHHSFIRMSHHSFIRVPWLVDTRDLIYVYVWLELLIRVTWSMYTCGLSCWYMTVDRDRWQRYMTEINDRDTWQRAQTLCADDLCIPLKESFKQWHVTRIWLHVTRLLLTHVIRLISRVTCGLTCWYASPVTLFRRQAYQQLKPHVCYDSFIHVSAMCQQDACVSARSMCVKKMHVACHLTCRYVFHSLVLHLTCELTCHLFLLDLFAVEMFQAWLIHARDITPSGMTL